MGGEKAGYLFHFFGAFTGHYYATTQVQSDKPLAQTYQANVKFSLPNGPGNVWEVHGVSDSVN